MAKDWRRPTEAARRHWKQREAGQTSTAARGVKRLIFTLLTFVLIGVLIWYLIPRGQKVYFAYLAEDYGPTLREPAKVEVATLAPPVATSRGVYSREFAPLGKRIFPNQFTVANIADGGKSKLTAQKLVESLTAPLKDKWNLGDVEFLVLYVSAHGVSIDGEPYLMWNEDYAAELARRADGESKPGLMRLDDLLEQVEGLDAKQKLLVLDCGSFVADPRLGMFVNEFPRLAERRVAASGDRSLWVLTSHAALEQAHIYAADRTSVFGHFVSKGVAGASRSRDDEDLSLGAFVSYVVSEVGKTVASRTGEVQTPRLINGELGVLAAKDVPNVNFLKYDFFDRDVDVASDSRHDRAESAAAGESLARGDRGSARLPAALAAMALAQGPGAAGDAAVKPVAPAQGAPAAAGNTANDKPPEAANAAAAPAADGANPTPAAAAASPPATAVAPVVPPPASTPPPGSEAKNGPPTSVGFADVWNRIEKIEDPQENPGSWSPVDYAPHLWAQFRRQVAWYESRYEIEREERTENAAFIAAEILAPLDGVLLGDKVESDSPTTSIDVFGELKRARAAFRGGAAYASAADTTQRSVRNFVKAVRLKNYLTFRVVEQVRHYGYLPDADSRRYRALDAAIGELQQVTTQLETEARSSLKEKDWTSNPAAIERLWSLRESLRELPDVQRVLYAVGTVPSEAPANVASSPPPDITDMQPALWVDLYLKTTRLSQRDETGAAPSDVALISVAGTSDVKLSDYVEQIRRIAGGSAPRSDEGAYWQAYRAVGLQVRRFTENLEVGLRRGADGSRDDTALCNLERSLRLVDGRDAPDVRQTDNVLPRRRICPPIAHRVEVTFAETKIGLPPRGADGSGRTTVIPKYVWHGPTPAQATFRVSYKNPAAAKNIMDVVSPPLDTPIEISLAAEGELPKIVLKQAADRVDETKSEPAVLQVVVEVIGDAPQRQTMAELTVEAHGSELVKLAVYRVRGGVDVPIDQAGDDEPVTEIDKLRSRDGAVKARLFHVLLRPFPNRADQYRFKLTNVSGEAGTRDVRVDLLEIQRPFADPIKAVGPNGELDPESFRVVEEFRRELSLSANAPLTFPFVEPPKPAADGAEKPAVAAAAAAPPAGEKKDAAPPPPIADFRHGMVFRIQDKNKPELVWYHWVEFRARHPDRYVRQKVTYDSQRGRLEIRIWPRDDATLPPDGFSAKWRTDGVEIDPQLPRTMEVLKKREDEIRLGVSGWHPPEPRRDEKRIPIFVTVDDYPRAFIYEFTPAVGRDDEVKPTQNYPRVRIVEPPRDFFAYKKDGPGEVRVNVGVEVDGLPSDRVAVRFGDGNNPEKQIDSWRAEHVLLFEKGWDKEGVLTLTSTIGDHVGGDALVFYTSRTEESIPVEVELKEGQTTKGEDRRHVVIDTQPPTLSMGDPSPAKAVAEKGLEVTVTPTVFDAGGVVRIEFFIVAASKNRLSDEEQAKPAFIWPPPPPPGETAPPIVESKAIPIKIPFEGGPGRWSIWAVAVNQVDRRSNPVRTSNSVDIEEPKKETMPEKGGGVTIVGITTLYDKPLANVTLKLVPLEEGKGTPQSTTSVDPSPVDFVDEAAYKFETVPPGEYKIVATGKAKNGRTVVGEVPKVVVTDKDKGTKSFDIKLALP
ncbi:MAG: hypothetical protein WD875_15535 [Pirellulales bacterium]